MKNAQAQQKVTARKKNGDVTRHITDDFETKNAKYQKTVTPKLSTNCPNKKSW